MSHPTLDWQDQAVCTTADAYDFTADKKPADAEIQRLQWFCSHCPVTGKCAAIGLNSGVAGVWGGIYLPGRGAGRAHARILLSQKVGAA